MTLAPTPGQTIGPFFGYALPYDADSELVGLARTCLAAAPKHRPRDAGIVADGLTAYLRGVEGRLREAELAQARAETRAAEERQAAGKDTGTIRFDEGDFTVVADLPKRVDWDQDRLAAMVERIRAAGDDPAQYVDIAFKVPERKYAAWPDAIRAGFEPARTVRPGTLKIEIVPQGGDQ